MRRTIVLAAVLAPLLSTSCKTVECGDGTTERDGVCVAANLATSNAVCGPFTHLEGTQCAPDFDPAVCDPASTEADLGADGVITCIGTGNAGCSAKLACPTPTDGTQTICGQIYDFETGEPFAAADAKGEKCTGATTGPCSLGIATYDAVAFAGGDRTALPNGGVYIDDCGRYRVEKVAQPGGPFILLALDDASAGPGGTTNAVGVATPKAPNASTKDFDHFIVKGSTVAGWGGTPSLANGIYAGIFRGHSTGTDLAAGVTFVITLMTNPGGFAPDPSRDFYFTSATNRSALDAAANATSINGGALLSGANLTELYAGVSSANPQCLWEPHAGSAAAGSIFVQVFRPTNAPGMTCPL